MPRYRRNKALAFKNNEYIGAYADISFDIISETDLGSEALRFDTKLHYLEMGQGEPLLFLHGLGQSLYTWRHSLSFFAENGYRVIAPDMVGFGYSGHLNIYYTIEENALAIHAFLETLKIRKVSIIGFSTGALCALSLAATYPGLVDRLVLVSPGGPNEHYPFALRFLATRLGALIFRNYFRETSMRNVLSDLYFDATHLTNDVLEGYYAPFHDKETREALIRSILHFDDTWVRTQVKNIRHKTLVFSGTGDRMHTDEVVNQLTLPLQHKRRIRVRNCGHLVHEEKCARFNSETLAFLKEADKPAEFEVWPVIE